MPTIYTEVEVDVTMESFSDDDLLDELSNRGLGAETLKDTTATKLIHKIHLKRRLGKDFSQELDDLIYDVTGYIV